MVHLDLHNLTTFLALSVNDLKLIDCNPNRWGSQVFSELHTSASSPVLHPHASEPLHYCTERLRREVIRSVRKYHVFIVSNITCHRRLLSRYSCSAARAGQSREHTASHVTVKVWETETSSHATAVSTRTSKWNVSLTSTLFSYIEYFGHVF